VLVTLALVSAWTPIDERQSQFYGLVLFLEAGLLGVFTALDFFVWFVFWEAVLVPMYFLIGVWGGPRRKYAAIKMFVYTNIASLVMFVGYTALVFGLGDAVSTFAMPETAEALVVENVQPDALAFVDAETTFDGTAVVVRDISERKRMEAELVAQKRKIEALHAIASDLDDCETRDEIWTLTVEAAERVLDFDICCVDEEVDEFLVSRALSSEVEPRGYNDRAPVTQGLAGKTHTERASLSSSTT